MNYEGEAEIRRAMEELNSLVEGERAVAKLLALGEAAIPALRDFLLRGAPSSIYQPRRWAVEALAGLGAKDVLLEFLRMERRLADPVLRMAEEAVENEAARRLAAWRSREVWETLLELAGDRPRAGVLEALGQFVRPEAAPYFISALEDDICRSVAEEALRKLGAAVKPELLRAALTPWPCRDEETPSSLRRRTSAAELLADLGVTREEWLELRPLVDETDPSLLAAVGRMAASAAEADERRAIAARLLGALESADWSVRMEIEELLVAFYDAAETAIEDMIARRRNPPGTAAALDPLIRLLERVRRRAKTERSGTCPM